LIQFRNSEGGCYAAIATGILDLLPTIFKVSQVFKKEWALLLKERIHAHHTKTTRRNGFFWVISWIGLGEIVDQRQFEGND
jgi:hypothetical protein